MGINRPSLYAAFGSKEELFRKALDRYASGPGCYIQKALEEPTAREVYEKLLTGSVEMLTNPKNPQGCLAVQGALACGTDADPIRKELADRRAAGVAAIRERFERAKREGDLPAAVSPAALAFFTGTILHGLSVEATSGATRKELQGVVALALKAWPGQGGS